MLHKIEVPLDKDGNMNFECLNGFFNILLELDLLYKLYGAYLFLSAIYWGLKILLNQ
jgi:hypothetical protein